METTEIIAVLRRNGLTIRMIEKATGIPKSTIHRWLSNQPDIVIRENEPAIDEGYKFFFLHFPYTFYCPGCGLEQNHAWFCDECGVLIPAECEENEACAKGFNIKEVTWGQRV